MIEPEDLRELADLTTYEGFYKDFKTDKIKIYADVIGDDDVTEWLRSEIGADHTIINKVSCSYAKYGVEGLPRGTKKEGLDGLIDGYLYQYKKEKLPLPERPEKPIGLTPVQLVGLHKGDDGCGSFREVYSCGEPEHDKKVTRWMCGNRTCSVCWRSWAKREVAVVTERLTALGELYDKKYRMSKLKQKDLKGGDVVKNDWLNGSRLDEIAILKNPGPEYADHKRKYFTCKHITVSPPQAWAIERIEQSGIQGFRYVRTRAVQVIKEAGLTGGVVIFHPFRVTSEYQEKFKELKSMKSGDPENIEDTRGGIWEWLRYQGMPPEAYYVSPHFHILGYGYLEKSDEFNERTKFKRGPHKGEGWVYHNHGYRSSELDKVKTISYLLTHTAVVGMPGPDGRYPIQSVTYMGDMGYQELKSSEELIEEAGLCPECGEQMFKLRGWDEIVIHDCDDYQGIGLSFEGVDYDKHLCTDDELRIFRSIRTYWLKDHKEITVKFSDDPPPDPPPKKEIPAGPHTAEGRHHRTVLGGVGSYHKKEPEAT